MGVKFSHYMYENELRLSIKGINTRELQRRGFFFHSLPFPSLVYQSWYSRETHEILLKSFWFYWMLECRLNKDTDLWHTVIFPSVQIWLSIHCFTDNSHQSLTLPQKSYFFLFWCYINRRGEKRLHVRGQTQESNAKVCAGQVFALVPTSEIIRKYMRCLLGIIHSFAKYIRFTKNPNTIQAIAGSYVWEVIQEKCGVWLLWITMVTNMWA